MNRVERRYRMKESRDGYIARAAHRNLVASGILAGSSKIKKMAMKSNSYQERNYCICHR